MINLRRQFMLCSSAASLALACLGVPALAQSTSDAGSNIESVTVTGTRITIEGYQAPTPVTVLGLDELNRDAQVNIADELVQLPSVGASVTLDNGTNTGLFSQGSAALSQVNLRNLGVVRTLVLFDGQRVVSSNLNVGGVDLSTIPTDLVSRVDVVTGGASAVYGSDAVAGVVNLVLNKTFTGIKADLEGSDSTTVERREAKVALTYGTDFAGDKGHLILSGDHTWSPDPVFVTEPSWYTGSAIVQNPAATSTNGLPYYITARDTGSAAYVEGGLITANTAGGVGSAITANSLKGTTFGSGGTPAPFNYGTLNANNTSVCYNGCTANAFNTINISALDAIPYHNSTFFGYASYKLTPDIQVSLQLNYGLLSEVNTGGNRASSNVIPADNAYLPKSIAAQFGTLSNGYNAATGTGGTAAIPTQSVTIGSDNNNNLVPGSPLSIKQLCNDTVGVPCLDINRALSRGVFTVQGALGGDWSWNVYADHGDMRERQVAKQDPYGPNFNNAVDAIVVTPTNVGSSGLPLGSIQCRVALTTPGTGCAPLDIFGIGVASQAAIDYVNPGQNPASGILNQELIVMNQDVFDGSMQGTLPWGLPAGNIAVAFGGEYRHEEGGIPEADPHGVLVPGPWSAGNFSPFKGQYNVKEGFLEADIPVLKDQYVESLALNMAGRLTDYSTSGLVETWKIGSVTQINDDFRLRTTWSLDIRAPDLTELFSPSLNSIGQLQYPLGSPGYTATTAVGGNPNLQPEKAITLSGGIVMTPHWIDGLSLSFDWYNINIHGYIDTVAAQTEINRCLSGETIYCSTLTFSPTFNGGAQPELVTSIPQNAASLRTSGLDVTGSYITAFLGGSLGLNLRANYTDELTETAIGVTYDDAGVLTSPLAYASSTEPKFHGNLSATYAAGAWSGTIQGRFIGAATLATPVAGLIAQGVGPASLSSTGVLTPGVGNCSLIAQCYQAPVGYLDLRLSYKWTSDIELYAAVDNATDVPRPLNGASNVYDILGRIVRAGIRFSN